MDLLTQGLLGGAAAASVAKRPELCRGGAVGFLAAMLADADTLIRSAQDPLLNLEFHRHFSHALVFVPVGALVAALLLWPFLRRHLPFARIYVYALAGYATSGLLDACTSYGTHLLWPFSDERTAWSVIAIVDPVFSAILVTALVLCWRRRLPGPARAGLALAGAYLLLGAWQHQLALDAAREIAASRGHEVQRVIVKPTIANLVLWRSVYESGGRYFVDAVRVVPGSTRVYAGESVPRFDAGRDFPDLPADSVLARDIRRFSAFSDGFVAAAADREGVLFDVRFSMLPTAIAPMWGIDFDAGSPGERANFATWRERPAGFREAFVAMLLGREPTD